MRVYIAEQSREEVNSENREKIEGAEKRCENRV